MIKYLVINDPHLHTQAPSSRRTDDYEQAAFDKLDQVYGLADQHEVMAVLCTGDWFHKKAPTAVPYRLTRRLIEWINGLHYLGIPVVSVAGNHDVQWFDTSEASLERQPYGLLMQSEGFHHVGNGRFASFNNVTGGSTETLLIHGSNYHRPERHPETGEMAEPLVQFRGDADLRDPDHVTLRVQIVHASVVPTKPVWTPYTLVADAVRVTEADVMHCGHIHDDLGLHWGTNAVGNPCLWTNVGSLTRGSLTEETLAREPTALLIEAEQSPVVGGAGPWSITPRRIPLRCAPHAEIYDLAAYRERKENAAVTATWGATLRQELADAGTADGEEETLAALIERSAALDHSSRLVAHAILNEVEA